jgi:hypothetical protein
VGRTGFGHRQKAAICVANEPLLAPVEGDGVPGGSVNTTVSSGPPPDSAMPDGVTDHYRAKGAFGKIPKNVSLMQQSLGIALPQEKLR